MNILMCMCMISASAGIIITDNVLFYEGNLKITTFFLGDTVTIDGYHGDTVLVRFNEASGILLKGVLIDLDAEIAEEQLLVFARGYYDMGLFPQAVRLFVHFLHFCSGSQYYPEALFYTGRTFDALASQGAGYDTFPGITMNERTGQYYYTGTAYKQILEQFPESPYAAGSAYYLILSMRVAREPWNGSIDVIEKDLQRLQNIISSYDEFEERAAVLQEIGFDFRALFELSSDRSYLDQAKTVFQTVIRDYPATVHEAGARVHLYEIEKGISIYQY